MGISVDLYRARIGLFSAAHSSETFRTLSGHCDCSLLLKCLPLAAICMLLLMAGIEPNPGPICSTCNLALSSVKNYYRHVTAHSFRKNLKVPCFFDKCDHRFSSLASLQSHYSRCHGKTKFNVPHQLTCVVCPVETCGMKLNSRKIYLAHMREHLADGKNFTCLFENCDTVIKSKNQFGTHNSRYHPGEDIIPVELHASLEPALSLSPPMVDMETHLPDDVEDPMMDPSITLQNYSNLSEDIFPHSVIKDEVARFYLKLEGKFLVPSSTVQAISDEIKVLTELCHHSLKRALYEELQKVGLEDSVANSIIKTTFKNDPLYNVHHKGEDIEQLGTSHLRDQYWKKHFKFVEPQEIYLGLDDCGKKTYAHYVPITESLKAMLQDEKVKTLVQQSFIVKEQPSNVLSDFSDGLIFNQHQSTHENRKCIQILLFQDAFEFNPFGPAKGNFKPVGFYFTLGNLPPEHRSREDMIMLAYMILEKHLRPSEAEDLQDVDKLKTALKPLLDELSRLKTEGIVIDGEKIPVCLLFCLGDNLGQHQMGGFVQSFSAEFSCRFCPVSKSQFLADPSVSIPLRTAADYDEYVRKARSKWLSMRRKALQYEKNQNRRKSVQQFAARLSSKTGGQGIKKALKRLVSKAAYRNLCSVNYRGVKRHPSPFNSKALGFHVCSPAMPPCLAHDLFEGIVKSILAHILKYFITVKEWFDLPTLNRRIKNFKCQGSDNRDAPTQLKSLENLSGNASENWNLLRLLPFIIGDLIVDKDEEMWLLFLDLKEICEFVCAPKISIDQVAYLDVLIRSFLEKVKKLLPWCLTPKAHILSHYASSLISLFGPLIRLFTLRYESKHTFFKKVARTCKNYINITHTLTRKFMYRFAYDLSCEVLPSAVLYDPNKTSILYQEFIQEDKLAAFPKDFSFNDHVVVDSVAINGIEYKKGYFMILNSDGAADLLVGLIDTIVVSISSDHVLFVFEEKVAENSFNGYFIINNAPKTTKVFSLRSFASLVDYYPLPSYSYDGKQCLSLKHSALCMI